VLPAPATWPPQSPAARRLVLEALESGQLCGFAGNDAPLRTEWERAAAESRGYRFGVGVTNGTRALAMATKAELVFRGEAWCRGRKTIVLPTFTWVPGTLAGVEQGVLEALGFLPNVKLFDSRETDWTIDAGALVSWLRSAPRGRRADRAEPARHMGATGGDRSRRARARRPRHPRRGAVRRRALRRHARRLGHRVPPAREAPRVRHGRGGRRLHQRRRPRLRRPVADRLRERPVRPARPDRRQAAGDQDPAHRERPPLRSAGRRRPGSLARLGAVAADDPPVRRAIGTELLGPTASRSSSRRPSRKAGTAGRRTASG